MFESTIHRLRIFQCVVDSGSFNAASRKLNVTQPAISSHIQSLEQECGKKLFIRKPGRKATLSEAGKILYNYASDISIKTAHFESNIKKINSEQHPVSIAVQRNIANNLLPGYLAAFSKTHPDVEIIMYSQTQETVISHVRERKADLGLIMTLNPVEGLYSEILTNKTLELVVGPSHELSSRETITPNELENYPFVGPLNMSTHAKVTNLALKKLGINRYNTVLQVEDSKTMIEIAKRGIGIASIPTFSINEELKTGKLISLPLNCKKAMIEIRLLYNAELKMNDETRLFMLFLRRELSGS